MWIFSSTKDYSEMVDKISYSVFSITSIFLFLLSQMCEEFMEMLEKISFGATIEIFNLKLCLAIFYIPLIMGLFEHMFKLHDIISSLFGIRKRFDKTVIVNEFLKLLELKQDIEKITDKQVTKIMSTCFYHYASSTNPIIDSHCIILSLTEWCWFWIVLDTLLLYDVIGIVWLILSWWSWKNLWLFVAIEFPLIVLLFLIYNTAKKYAKREVNAIISIKNGDKEMKDTIKEAVKNALSDK